MCIVHGCPHDATKDGRCPTHQRKWVNRNRRDHLTVSGWEEQRRAKRVIARDGGRCYLCGLYGADQADHVVPLFEGGQDDEHTNMHAVHATPCHEEKTKTERARARARRRHGVG